MAIRRGFTLVEMVIVIAILAILAAVATPRLTLSAGMRAGARPARWCSTSGFARTKALASKRITRLVFDTAGGTYTWVSRHRRRHGVRLQYRGVRRARRRQAAKPSRCGCVLMGRRAHLLFGDTLEAPVTLPNSRIDFDPAGPTRPLNSLGTTMCATRTHSACEIAAVTMPAARRRSGLDLSGRGLAMIPNERGDTLISVTVALMVLAVGLCLVKGTQTAPPSA